MRVIRAAHGQKSRELNFYLNRNPSFSPSRRSVAHALRASSTRRVAGRAACDGRAAMGPLRNRAIRREQDPRSNMSNHNLLIHRAERIANEHLLKLGIRVSLRTARKHLPRRPTRRPRGICAGRRSCAGMLRAVRRDRQDARSALRKVLTARPHATADSEWRSASVPARDWPWPLPPPPDEAAWRLAPHR
jgi:hypothetical protein